MHRSIMLVRATRSGMPTHPIDEPLASLRRVIEALHTSARAVERRTGITNAQLFLLHLLNDQDGMTVGDLGKLAHVHQSTASIVVGRLARAELVRRTRATQDARQVRVELTETGRRLLTRAPQPPSVRLFRALTRLQAADRRALTRGLRALERAMGLPPAPTQGKMLFEP
jgi:MarR family transcriptional regulator, organic hydroperoxide resistance regulator